MRATLVVILVSFIAGSVFGYNVKTWRLEWLKRKKDRLENKLRQVDSQIEDEMTTSRRAKIVNVNITRKELKS